MLKILLLLLIPLPLFSCAGKIEPAAQNGRLITATVTAYCPCEKCCGAYSAAKKTSTGKSAWTEGVAVAPQAIPYGSWLWIDGIGWRQADDTGGAMRQAWKKHRKYHVDLRMKTHAQARAWGKKRITIFILEEKYV